MFIVSAITKLFHWLTKIKVLSILFMYCELHILYMNTDRVRKMTHILPFVFNQCKLPDDCTTFRPFSKGWSLENPQEVLKSLYRELFTIFQMLVKYQIHSRANARHENHACIDHDFHHINSMVNGWINVDVCITVKMHANDNNLKLKQPINDTFDFNLHNQTGYEPVDSLQILISNSCYF